MEKITEEARYRQSLMKYAQKRGVAAASRKYSKSRSYIYFLRKRRDGSEQFLKDRSRRPHHHPNEHTQAELRQIPTMRRKNPTLGLFELWYRLQLRGYKETV